MGFKNFFKVYILTFCIIFVLVSVYTSSVSIIYLFLYFASILGIIYFIDKTVHLRLVEHIKNTHHKDLLTIGLLSIIQISVLQSFSTIPYHFHQDEFITAYISYHLPSIFQLNWFGVYPNLGEWVSQFPVLFFILQKPFLYILSPSVNSIRISTLPYEILTIIYLYLLSKEYFKTRILAILCVLIFIFLAGNIWISSLGLHFSSSTFFFLASFYYFYLLTLRKHTLYAILCGLFLGLSYLSYSSSYIVFPLIALFTLFEVIHAKSLLPLKYFVYSASVFIIITLPLIIFAITKDNFFTQRIGQVNFLWGSWYDTQNKIKEGQNFISLLIPQILNNLKSLYTPGIGGTGGYSFGNQSLFNIPTFTIIIFGFTASLYKIIFKKDIFPLYIIISIILIFIFGMILTLPVGAFHRVSIAFPFLAIIITLGISIIVKLIKLKSLRLAFISIFIVLFALSNLTSVIKMIAIEKTLSPMDEVYIANYINQNIAPGQQIFIAAFPAYHLEKELFFRTSNRYLLKTDYYESLKPEITNQTLILLDPTAQLPDIKKTYPNGVLIDKVNGNYLQNLKIFIPR